MNTKQICSILFYPIASKLNKQGLVPIYMRLTIHGQRTDTSTGKWIEAAKWNTNTHRVRGNSEEVNIINKFLVDLENKANKQFDELAGKQDHLTSDMLRAALQPSSDRPVGFIEYFEKFIERARKRTECKDQNGHPDLSIGTLHRFERVKRFFKQFLKEKMNRTEIDWFELDAAVANKFANWCMSTPHRSSEHTGTNGTNQYMKVLKQVANDAVMNIPNIVTHNPFAAYKCKYKKFKRTALNEEEVTRIINLDLSHLPKLERVRDVFVFSCFTGMSYADIATSKASSYFTDANGDKWIQAARVKTNHEFQIPMLDIPQKLIEMYKGHPLSNGHLFPVLSNQKMNAYLKNVQVMAEIDKPLSCHVARHTAATMLLNAGVPEQTVSYILGHAAISTTRIYTKISTGRVKVDTAELNGKFRKMYRKVGRNTGTIRPLQAVS